MFQHDKSGTTAIIAAIALPSLVLTVGAAVDFATVIHQKSVLQAATDAAALASAQELSLSNAKDIDLAAIAASIAATYLDRNGSDDDDDDDDDDSGISTETVVRSKPLEVEVRSRLTTKTFFGNAFGLLPSEIETKATARVIGQPNICVLALHDAGAGTLLFEKNARITGDNCAIFSNSTHNIGIQARNSARVTATSICSAGGVDGKNVGFTPIPYLDCPQFEDPLANRPEPTVRDCDDQKLTQIRTDQTLYPGTYCGLLIDQSAQVTLKPGTYVIKDGPFTVTGGASISGKDVGFYITGKRGRIRFDARSSINLEAPTTGKMAGLLIFAARHSSRNNDHLILSEGAQNMVGTIYIPTGNLQIGGSAEVGGDAAYTAIVTQKLRLFGGPHVRLNTNYHETTVPVPAGIRGATQPVALVN